MNRKRHEFFSAGGSFQHRALRARLHGHRRRVQPASIVSERIPGHFLQVTLRQSVKIPPEIELVIHFLLDLSYRSPIMDEDRELLCRATIDGV